MNAFDAFIRFFALADDTAKRPTNLGLTAEPYPKLPIVKNDRLRWLVTPSDLAGIPVNQVIVSIRPVGTSGLGTDCGTIRPQAGSTYSEIRIRVQNAPDGVTWKQFAILLNGKPVLGTFFDQSTDFERYLLNLRNFYRNNAYAHVDVDRFGHDLRLRVYTSDKLSLSGETLSIGLGTVTDQNTNTPSLLPTLKPSVTFAAEDHYTVVIGADIQAGNIYTLNSVSYTAVGTERPTDILENLGLPDSGLLVLSAGAAVSVFAQPGAQTITNQNHPVLQLLYQSTAGGVDKYLAKVSGTVTVGNIYQISAPGQTTKTITASSTDSATTLATAFNSNGGFFTLPAGTVPSVTVLAGSQSVNNTNNPTINLTGKTSLPARTLDCYTVFVGASVAAGNRYSLTIDGEETTATADDGDTPLQIAAKLGYLENPFTVNVTQGVSVLGKALRGPRYHEPANLADVQLLPSFSLNRLPYVADVKIPTTLTPGNYQFVLYNGSQMDPVPIAVSNLLRLKPDTKDTSLLRFGTKQPEQVFGLRYNEDGLYQQLRLPLYLDTAPKLQQSETITRGLDLRQIRTQAQAWFSYALTSTQQPPSFIRNLYVALKHPVVYLNHKPYTCDAELTLSDVEGHRRYQQATTMLTAREGLEYEQTSDLSSDLLSDGYTLINTIDGGDGLWIAARYFNFVQVLTPGTVLPSADYDLLIRTGAYSLLLTVGQDGSRLGTFLCVNNTVNRFRLRFSPGLLSLSLRPVDATVKTSGGILNLDYYSDINYVEILATEPETTTRQSDFNSDFNDDF